MRVVPSEGAEVIVQYLASAETGTVERVEDGGHTVVVVTESGAVLDFHLMASAHFLTRDRSARLALRS